MDENKRRVWAEVDLGAISQNIAAMKQLLQPGRSILGVVKANAYGHGSVPVAKRLVACGCPCLAVACIEEAAQLRQAGIDTPILILGYTDPADTAGLLDMDIIQCVDSLDLAKALSEAAVAAGGRLRVHLKLDSGMGRLGLPLHSRGDHLAELCTMMDLPGLQVEGIFTHFAVSDEAWGEAYTQEQFQLFSKQIAELEKKTHQFVPIKHCANSGAMVNYPYTHLDMVRPGIATYGMYAGLGADKLSQHQAMTLKARVISIKEMDAGSAVSYGCTYTLSSRRRVAVLSIGYGDGLPRLLSGKMEVLIRGCKVPQIGRICMDMCMADVTDVPQAVVGDEIVIFGTDAYGNTISAVDLAERIGTIAYELTCGVSTRVHRVYLD